MRKQLGHDGWRDIADARIDPQLTSRLFWARYAVGRRVVNVRWFVRQKIYDNQ